MSDPFHRELKKEFQLERVILFSDAVFAIAITLLAIEIKVPEIAKNVVSDHLLLEQLEEMIPKFIGFLVSFLVIGIYWVAHHRIFGFVTNYNHRLLWLNLVFLLAVVLMPFSSAFYSEYVFLGLVSPMLVYAANVIFLGVMNLIIWNYVAKPARSLSEDITPEINRYYRFRAMVPILVFTAFSIFYLINPTLAVFMPLLILPIMRLLRRRFFKPRGTKHKKP